MTNDTSLGSSYALLLESTNKFANLQICKNNFFVAKSIFINKMLGRKVQKMIKYTFMISPRPCNSNMQIIFKTCATCFLMP